MSPRGARTAADNNTVRIRMYNVGFGDAFLIFVPSGTGTGKILVDCGSISSGGVAIEDVVRQIIADAKDPDGVPRIQVVVATHRHRDHVSGFASGRWKQVEVGEVWLPWTEDPDDPKAAEIRHTQSGLAVALASRAMRGMRNALGARSAEAGVHESLALNAVTNEAAMNTLHSGFGGSPKRRFLPVKDTVNQEFTPAGLPSVTVHVLGPSRDPKIIQDMDPPTGKSYLWMIENGSGSEGGDSRKVKYLRPFPEMPNLRSPKNALGRASGLLLAKEKKLLRGIGSETESAIAVALDQAVNGTSLMLVLRVGSASLLLPGDAQWGTWNAALGSAKAVALMKQTTFYKIGHHGSHNATPKPFVEQTIGRNFWAMVSTKTRQMWPNIPKTELLAALRLRTELLARSDQMNKAPTGFVKVGPFTLEAKVPC